MRARKTEFDSIEDMLPSDKKRDEAVAPLANLSASHTAISGKPGEAGCCVPCVSADAPLLLAEDVLTAGVRLASPN